MKEFIRFERIVTEEQLTEINVNMKKRRNPYSIKHILDAYKTAFCSSAMLISSQRIKPSLMWVTI